jgi:transportin-1
MIQKLNSFTRAPDYIAYLAYILTAMPEQEERIRTIAGYLLKNNARLILSASPEVARYVKASVLQAFTDASIMIRNAAGQDVVAFLGALEPKNWPECLEQLVTLLDSPDLDRQEVSHLLHYIMGPAWQCRATWHDCSREFGDEAGFWLGWKPKARMALM